MLGGEQGGVLGVARPKGDARGVPAFGENQEFGGRVQPRGAQRVRERADAGAGAATELQNVPRRRRQRGKKVEEAGLVGRHRLAAFGVVERVI